MWREAEIRDRDKVLRRHISLHILLTFAIPFFSFCETFQYPYNSLFPLSKLEWVLITCIQKLIIAL